ncbi:MAG: hypothetical protein PHF31_12950 [Methylobacter sp.]|nr:hypothetical protein [Methylobacter sp.]
MLRWGLENIGNGNDAASQIQFCVVVFERITVAVQGLMVESGLYRNL